MRSGTRLLPRGVPVTAQPGDRLVAYATLTYLNQSADPLLGSPLRVLDPADMLAGIKFRRPACRHGRHPGHSPETLGQASAGPLDGEAPAGACW